MFVLLAIAVPVTLALRLCYRHSRGIEVCLHNVDSEPLHAGIVAVSSDVAPRMYTLADLAPNATVCVWVEPEGEASIDVTFRLPTGASKPILLDGYVESGYTGSISADVTASGARAIKRDIDFF
jgi:hypothetical protein